jgi:ATP-dependent DNA helicase RecQ
VVQGAIYRMMVDGIAEVVPRGALVDVRVKATSLDEESRRDIASRLKSRASTAYAQIRDVESYANLSACRREHLLRHFGDTEEVAPCSGCDFCLGEVYQAPKTVVTAGARMVAGAPVNGSNPDVDPGLFERLRSWRGEKAREQKVPAYVVLHNSHLEEISATKPRTIQELGSIKGVGLRRAARYGEELLALVNGESREADLPTPSTEPPGTNGYRSHLEVAEGLIQVGRGADAVPELARALELGGDEARHEINELLRKS